MAAGDYVLQSDGTILEQPTGRVFLRDDLNYEFYLSRVGWGSAYVPSVTDSQALIDAGRSDVVTSLISRAKEWSPAPNYDVLNRINQRGIATVTQTAAPAVSRLSQISPWVWVGAAGVALLLLVRGR